MDILRFIGKFHLVLLHLPIGFLLLAFLMESYSKWKQTTEYQSAIRFTLLLGFGGAFLSALTGYWLSLNGGYDSSFLGWHKWLGISVVVLSGLVYFIHQGAASTNNKFYFPLFSILILALIGTGHIGGSLTHGSDFLSFSNNPSGKKQIVDLENAQVFSDLIQPILKEKCVRCHSASKTKGDLLMATIEGLQKGGKTGPLFVKGSVEESLIMERIHLPLEEEEHMPPEGKLQLTEDEIALLSWWIEQEASFEAKVKELKKKDEIDAILKKFIVPEDDIFSVEVAQVKESTLEKLKAKDIPILRVAENSNFVEVDFSRQEGINKKILQQLSPVSKQLIRLNLTGTDISDKDLSVIKNFPHLEKLYLQKTNITDAGMSHLRNLTYLNYLNLYDTQVTDESLAILSQLKRLKKLYLWQTSTTEEAIAQFKENNPKIQVNTGVSKVIFGDARLKAPLILSEKDLFTDTMSVKFKLNFKGVDIFYTLDGKNPDSTSQKYEAPILLDKTATIKVIAQKEGWKASEIASKQFAKVKYSPVNIKLNQPPHEKYAAKGANSLVDLAKGSTTFTDGLWLGYEKQHVVATLDLGQSEMVSGVTVGALEAPGSYIFYPKGIKVSVSEDGKNYTEVSHEKYPIAAQNKPNEVSNFTTQIDPQKARYVQVKIESNLVNPDWHSAPGAPCWVFIDEISVE